jgi:hypothetical protein
MKKIIASAGLVAVGAASLHAANAPGLTPQETAKPWSVSASLMGFYDDNYATRPDGPAKESSFGVLFRPSFALNVPKDQTFIKLGLDYGLSYYADRPENEFDHNLQVMAKLDHRFSERHRVIVSDAFVYASEPEIIDSGTVAAPIKRTDNSAIRNSVSIDYTTVLTELVALNPGFQMDYVNYCDDGPGTYSALLDRLNYLVHLDARYQAREDLIALVGYQFGLVDYTSDESLDLADTPGSLQGTDRDFLSHTFYVGVDYDMTSQLKLGAKVGAQYAAFDTLDQNDGWSPYVDLQGTYTYLPGSYVQLGVRALQYPTDMVGDPTNPTGDDTVANQDLLMVYAAVNHKITPRLTGNLMGQYQYSQFNGGIYDGDNDNFYLVGVTLEYKIDNYWSVLGAYNFDKLESGADSARDYTRNRGYVGVSAKF